jgi:hypothetical protein
MNRFIGSSPVTTTNNHYTIADLQKLQSLHTSPHNLFPLVVATLAVAITHFTTDCTAYGSLKVFTFRVLVSGVPCML